MRAVFRTTIAILSIIAAVSFSLPPSPLARPEIAWAAAGATQAVVAQEAVVAKPYDLALAPDGEFRILHFDAGLVSSVLVAKPWLLTVLIQKNDVVLQAKASSGTTQLVAYVGDTGTLWQVAITAHDLAPMRITVRAPGEEPATAAVSSPAQAARAGQPAPSRDTRLTAFLGTLSPGQRAGFDAWQRNPRAAVLAEWLAGLSAAQRAAFATLVQDRVITVSSPLGPQVGAQTPPPLVDTTTVISQPSAPAQPGAGAAPAPVAPSPIPAPPAPSAPDVQAALYAEASNVPQGIDVTVGATQAAGGVEIQYAIHNGLGVSLAGAHVVATDGQGHAVGVSGVPAGAIAAGKDASGAVVVHASRFPVVLHWTWDERTIETILFMGRTVSRGSAQFDVVVTP